jgi:tetratricopeptide (TPR) repeat protein
MFGVSYNKLGSYQEANDVLMAGLDLANSDKGLLSELHVQLGIAKLGIKKGDEAQKHFDEALKLTNFSPYVKNELAFQLANFKIDFNTAEVLIDDLIKNNPDDALYIGTKGFILMQQKKYVDAEKYFLKSLSINSLQPFIHMYLGDLYNLTAKPTEAKRYWKEAQIQGLQFNSLDEKINK